MLALRQGGPGADAAPPPGPTEAVTRPPPGLARGKWEAPSWAFWVALAVVLVGVAGYVAWRAGLLRLRKAAPPEAKTPPHAPAPSADGLAKRGDRP